MKVMYSLLIIILASLCKAIDEKPKYCSQWRGDDAPHEPSDCFNLWINESRTTEDYKCCYETRQYYYKGEYYNSTRCVNLEKVEYDTLIPRVKSGVDYCSSNYLYISLLSLIIFLL